MASKLDPLKLLAGDRPALSFHGWPELVRFDISRDAPPFPTITLPPCLRDFAEALAGHFLTPVDLPAVMALGATSAACAGRVRLRVGPDWFEPANEYLLAIAPPSLHKSPTMKLATKPLEDEEREIVERWRADEADRRVRRDAIQASIKALKADGEPDDATLRASHDELASLAARPRPSLFSDDATSEALAVKLANGPLFVCSAEGRPFELMSGLYRANGEGDVDVYLKAWSEDPMRVTRITREELFVARPNLTICLAVQPAVVDKLARRDEFRGRGLIARFLASYPTTRVGDRDWSSSRPISRSALLEYDHRLRQLVGMARPDHGGELVSIGPDAEPAFALFRQEVETAQRSGGPLHEWQDLGGKLAGHAARLALVLHMVTHGPSGADRPIDVSTMTGAIELARYFVRHTVATWNICAVEPPAARVARWLARERSATVTTRDIHRAHQRLFERAQKVRDVCDELHERGYLRPQGQPDHWVVSPRVLFGSSGGDTVDDSGEERVRLRHHSRFRVSANTSTADDTADAASPLSSNSQALAVTANGTGNQSRSSREETLSPLSSRDRSKP